MDKNIKSINLEQMVKVISLSKRVKNPLDIKKTFNISLLNIHFILQNQNDILNRWRQRTYLNGIAKESSENINLECMLRKYQKSCSIMKEGISEHKNNDASRTTEHQETPILNESNEDVIFIEMPIKCIDITNEDTAVYNNIVKIKKEETNYTSLMDFPPMNTIKLEFEQENTKRTNIKQESWEYIEDGTNIRPVQIKNEIDYEIDEFEEFLGILDEHDETEYIEIYKIVDTEDEDDKGVDNKENANDLHKTEIERSSNKNKLNNYSCPQIKLEQNIDKLLDTPSKQTSKVENNTTTNTPVVGEDDDSEVIELLYEIEESDDLHKTEIERSSNKKKLNNYSCPQIKLEQNVDKLLDTPSKQTCKVENNTTTNTPVVGEDDDSEVIELVYEIEESDDLHKTEIEISSIKKELNIYSCPQIKLEQNFDKLLDTPSKQTSKEENNTTTNTPVVGEDDDSEVIELVYEIEESDEDVQNELMEIINKHKNTKPEICAYENHYGNKLEIKQEPLDDDAAKEEQEEEVITVLEIVSDDETVDYDKQDEESDLLKLKEAIRKSKRHRKQIQEDIHGTYRTIFHPPKSKSNVNDNIPSTSRSSRNESVPTSTPPNKKARLSFNPSKDLITSSIKSNEEAFKCVNYVLEYFQRQKDVEAVKQLHKLQLCFSNRN